VETKKKPSKHGVGNKTERREPKSRTNRVKRKKTRRPTKKKRRQKKRRRASGSKGGNDKQGHDVTKGTRHDPSARDLYGAALPRVTRKNSVPKKLQEERKGPLSERTPGGEIREKEIRQTNTKTTKKKGGLTATCGGTVERGLPEVTPKINEPEVR